MVTSLGIADLTRSERATQDAARADACVHVHGPCAGKLGTMRSDADAAVSLMCTWRSRQIGGSWPANQGLSPELGALHRQPTPPLSGSAPSPHLAVSGAYPQCQCPLASFRHQGQSRVWIGKEARRAQPPAWQ
jgi:hypothetical protein